MKILVVLPNLNGGGAQRMALDLAQRLQSSGDDVAICAAGSTGGFRGAVGSLKLYEQEARLRLASIVPFVALLRRAIRDHEPDVTIVHLLPLSLLVLLIRRLRLIRGRLVVVAHSHLSAQEQSEGVSALRRRWRSLAISRLYASADAVVGVSTAVADDIANRLKDASSVVAIPNGIDVERVRSLAAERTAASDFVILAGPPVLVAVGRLVALKGFDVLIEAFACVHAREAWATAELVILGDGPERAALEAQAGRLGVSGAVHFLGFVANPWAAMAQADVFVLSSRYEGFGLVVAEAITCGLPVVSTDCESGPADILKGDPRARLVPVDDPAAMADAVCAVLSDADSVPAVELAPQFTVEVMTARYRELLQSVVDAYGVSNGR